MTPLPRIQFSAFLVAAFLVAAVALGAEIPTARQSEYRRFQASNQRERGIIDQLEKIKFESVSFEGLTPGEALNYLRKRVVDDHGGGIINVVIRGSDVEKRKASMERGPMNYAGAVDEICIQTGWNWRIDFNEESGAPILILTKTAANKARTGMPDTR